MIKVVSRLRGWVLVDGRAIAPGDPLFTHMVTEGIYP